MIIVRPETASEQDAVADLLRRSYGREGEVERLNTLRASTDFLAPLSLVADKAGWLLGFVLFSRAGVVDGASSHSAVAMGLLAVLPEHRRQGVAERLIRHGLERCRGLGHKLVFTVGDPRYFSRLGFRPSVPLGLSPEFPASGGQMLALELDGKLLGSIKGVVRFPAALK